MQAASGRKTECRRRRARRASALMVVLALLFTMVPTGFATVAGAAEATETALPEPIPEPIPEPTPEPPTNDPADDTTDDTTDDPANDITDRAAPTATAVAVICYAAVDGGWKQVGTVQTDKIDSDSTRYYIMAAELDGIYGGYGFSSAKYNGDLFFPHTDDNSIDKLWADALPKNTDGAWQIPLSRKGPIYLYYLPANATGTQSYFTGSKPKTDAQLLADNMFYTITVEDPAHAVYDTPPVPQVLFHGGSTTVTLNKAEGVTWTAVNGKTNETLSLPMTEETAVTYTIENIAAPIRFRPRVAAGMIQYEAMPDGWMSKLGNFDVSRQQPQQTATVRGEAVFMALPAENSHTLLPPDIDRIAVSITDANNHTMFYSFAGWKVTSAAGSPVLPAGTVLTAEDLNRYADGTGTVTLQAVWSGVDSHNRPNTVHFFLHKNGELKGSVEDGVKPESSNDYTPAIYSTRMMNAGKIPVTYTGGTPLVARLNADDDAYQTNTTIRSMTTTPVEGATLEDLPGDETVFAYLRANHIQMMINGQVVDNEKLNTTYFGIRWNTVKYESSDGWHIDGVLVAKRSRFIVTKTFAGDAAAIALAKKDFTITVSHTEGSGSVTDFTLLPQPANEVNEAGKLGYTDYDAATETYTWEVPAQQKRSYTITEAGYIPSGNWRVSNSYAIRNNPEGGVTDYQSYPAAGIVITAVGYGDDVPPTAVQTVALRNVYVGVGTLTVNTQDAITGDNLRDIPYRLTRDGTAVTLYRRPGTTLYSMEKDDPGYTETISDGTLTAGANGLFTIRLETGTYTLTETLPTGYYGPGTVQVTVTKPADGPITYHSVAQNLPTEVTEPAGGWLKDAKTDHITILNVPRMLISVKARSSWPENGEKLPVTVQLWCDGTPVSGDQYTQVLSVTNNWEYTWQELPLFTNGTVAGYTLRVTKIGNTYRDAALDDGFADYDVTNDAVKYRKTGDPAYRADHMWEEDGVQHFAQEALLVVRNEGVLYQSG